MDPFLAFAAEFWWLAPIVAAGGAAATVAAVQYGKSEHARTLEYAAARHELDAARLRLRTARGEVKSAQAAHLVAKSARQSGQGSTGDVDAARRMITAAQRELRAAQTAVRGRRMQVQGARAMLRGTPRGRENLPLPRLVATHDRIVAQWMEYETDPAKAIAFPTMSDTRVPATSALLDALNRARWMRPTTPASKVTPEDFARYRAAVGELQTAFAVAEKEAWRAAGRPLEEGSPAAGSARFSVPPQIRLAWDEWLGDARAGLTSAAAAAAEAAMDAVSRAAQSPRRTADSPDDGAARNQPHASPTAPRKEDAERQSSAPRSDAPPPETPPATSPQTADRTRIWPVPRRPLR